MIGRRTALAGLVGGLAALWGATAEARKKPKRRAKAAAEARLRLAGSGAARHVIPLAGLGLAGARYLAVTGWVTLPPHGTCKVYLQDEADPRGTGVVMVEPGRRPVVAGVVVVRAGRLVVEAVGQFDWSVDVTLRAI